MGSDVEDRRKGLRDEKAGSTPHGSAGGGVRERELGSFEGLASGHGHTAAGSTVEVEEDAQIVPPGEADHALDVRRVAAGGQHALQR
jgi:hypothetical protein